MGSLLPELLFIIGIPILVLSALIIAIVKYKKQRKALLISIAVIVIPILSWLTINNYLTYGWFNKVEKNIKNQYPMVQDIKLSAMSHTFSFTCSFKDGANADNIPAVYESLKGFLLSSEGRENCEKTYQKKGKTFEVIWLRFDLNHDGKSECAYHSGYYIYLQGQEKQLDDYATWYYFEF